MIPSDLNQMSVQFWRSGCWRWSDFTNYFLRTRTHNNCTYKMTRSPTDTRLSGTFLRICSGLPWLSQAYYDQAPSCCTLMSTQLSLIMQDRKAAAQSSLFFHLPKYFWGSNSGSLWRVISERTHWCGGLGEGHVWTHRRERGRKQTSEGQSRMYVC